MRNPLRQTQTRQTTDDLSSLKENFDQKEKSYKSWGLNRTTDEKTIFLMRLADRFYQKAVEDDWGDLEIPSIVKQVKSVDRLVQLAAPMQEGGTSPGLLKVSKHYINIHKEWKLKVLQLKRMLRDQKNDTLEMGQTPEEYVDFLESFAEDIVFPSARKVWFASWKDKDYTGSWTGVIQVAGQMGFGGGGDGGLDTKITDLFDAMSKDGDAQKEEA